MKIAPLMATGQPVQLDPGDVVNFCLRDAPTVSQLVIDRPLIADTLVVFEPGDCGLNDALGAVVGLKRLEG